MCQKLVFFFFSLIIFSSCASIPMESREKSDKTKTFQTPSKGKSGLYIFRSGKQASEVKKFIWVDGKCLGESTADIFFYKEVEGGKEHTIATESELSPNSLVLKTKVGRLYFIQQHMKHASDGWVAGLDLVQEELAKKKILDLDMAKNSVCLEN